MDMTRLRKALAEAALDSLLGPNPIPTGIKPAVEIALNKNFFTGGTVTPRGLENVEAAEQYNASTSELGKILSAITSVPFSETITGTQKRVLNPIEADHLIKGLFGTTGQAVMWGTNFFSGDRPTPKERDNPMYGSFLAPEVARGREDMFYDFKEDVDKKYDTYMKLLDRGNDKEADAYYDKYEDLIAMHDYVSGIGSGLTAINKQIRSVGEIKDKSFTPDDRREEITDLQRQKMDMLQGIELMRKEAGL
jgi:hypothetical protein